MQGFEKYYKKDWSERLDILKSVLNEDELQLLQASVQNHELDETMIENFITEYHLPEGLALNYVVDGCEYLIPMVTEEPSVIAAASHGGSLVKKAGGFKTSFEERLMIGQVVIAGVVDEAKTLSLLQKQQDRLLETANLAHPSIVKRGGGAKKIRLRPLGQGMLSVDLFVDVKEAMGANMLNTMLEACGHYLTELNLDVVMCILSNYATASVVTSTCTLPSALLAKKGLDGSRIAQKIAQASQLAQIDPYRAATHNKGIMNGIDACVLASGNDFRAVEAGAHAYASRTGQYRGLTTWTYDEKKDELTGRIALPLALGSVGGSISIVPLVQVNRQLMQNPDAKRLAQIIASVGLGQNLAALYALVTEGIQQGHMRLQLKSLAKSVGAKENEINLLVEALEKVHKRDSHSAELLLAEIRENN